VIVKRALGFSVLGAVVLVLSQACGSDDPKNRDKDVRYTPDDGGEGGSSGGDGTAQPRGGQDGGGGDAQAGTDGGGTAGAGASFGSGAGGEAAAGGMSGGGGEAGSGATECPAGYAECDDDPSTVCEQNIGLITACGDCDTVCTTDNGTPTCEGGECVYACVDGFADCNVDGADGCEADLTSDETCGSCGRDCAALGATCAAAKCSDIPMQTGLPFGSDGSGNFSWAFGPLGIMHIDFYGYSVLRFPLDGSATQTTWTTTGKGAGSQPLVVVGDRVYWGERGTGGNDFTAAVFSKLVSAAAGAQPDLAFVPEWPVQFLRRQGNAFYWFSGDYQSGDPGAWIYTRSIASADLNDHGTQIMTVDQGTHNGITAFNVTSDALYWISTKANAGTAYELRSAPIGGGAPVVVPTVPGGTTPAVSGYYGVPTLFPVGNTLYFNRQTGEAVDGIYSFKQGDAAPTRLVTAANVQSFVVDANYIYYQQQNVGGVMRAPVAGGAGVQLSTGNLSKIVAQDDDFIYAVLSGCCTSTLHKIIK
jgi:hypothetical protein